jgi:hypothetical protein
VFGRFAFTEAQALFDLASTSHHVAVILRDSFLISNLELIDSSDFSSKGSIFSFLRCPSDDSIPLIRLLNSHLSDIVQDDHSCFNLWQELARNSFEFLVNLSRNESMILGSLPTNLVSCNSISEMSLLVFQIYAVGHSLRENVNHFLHYFPNRIIGQFMNELRGILHYIYLLQSSLEYCSHHHPLPTDVVVYRSLTCDGGNLASVYESMIGEMIVWVEFTKASVCRDSEIEDLINGNDGILFEILLHPGAVAVRIPECSAVNSEILIAASSGFMVEDVEYIDVPKKVSHNVTELRIPCVKLSYVMSWSDFDINERPEGEKFEI